MVLAYCILDSEKITTPPAAGVRGAAIETFSCDGLKCVISNHASLGQVSHQDALAFHQVIENIFKQVALVPFRFPTLLNSGTELEEHLKAHATQYKEDLQRFKHLVQMELHIAEKKTEPAAGTSSSGTGYLQARSQRAQVIASVAEAARQALVALVEDWRELAPLSASNPSLRCYALVARSSVHPFREKLLSRSLPPGITMAISGPWPATAFMSSQVADPAARP